MSDPREIPSSTMPHTPMTQQGSIEPTSLRQLFVAFSLLALQGFGGVMAIAQRELVERRRWVSREEFLEYWAVAQVLPGPNVANLAVMLGDRYMGARGALVSVAGLFAIPLVIVLGLAFVYSSLNHLAPVQGALRGMGLVVSTLIAATALKLMPALKTHPGGRLFCVLSGLATLWLTLWLQWSLLWVLLSVGTASCLWTYRQIGRQPGAERKPS